MYDHHPHRRRLVGAGLGLLVGLPLALAACGDGGSAAGGGADVKSLTVLDYYTDEPANTQISQMFNACGNASDVKIERQSVPGPQLMPRVLQQISSRTLPDILMINNPDVQQVAETGALTPLDELGISTDGYVEGVTSAVNYEGKAYGIGSTSNTLALFYNTKMFEDAGLEPPATWQEMTEAAEKLTEGNRYGIAFAAPADYEASWQFLPFLWSNGGDETRLDSSKAAEALQLWVDLVKSGAASESVVNWRQADVKDQFVAERTAMMVNGPWQIPALEEAGVPWDVVQIPVPNDGDTPVAPLGGEVWSVPRSDDQDRVDKAAEVLECVMSDKHSMQRAKDAFQVPSKVSVAERYGRQVPTMSAFVDQVTDARALTGKLGTEYPATAEALYQAIQAALTGESTPEQALKQAQEGRQE